jgi:ribosomal-protein-alanine N-acetyltransferase
MDLCHLDQVVAIEQQSFVSPWTRTLFLDELRIDIAQSSVAVMQQDNEQIVAGYMCIWVIKDECTILRIASHPEFRRKGIGRMLLERSCKKVRAQGATVVFLEVRPSNSAALAFYRACGFTSAGIRKGYYMETGEDAVILIKHLAEGSHNRHGSTDDLVPLSS